MSDRNKEDSNIIDFNNKKKIYHKLLRNKEKIFNIECILRQFYVGEKNFFLNQNIDNDSASNLKSKLKEVEKFFIGYAFHNNMNYFLCMHCDFMRKIHHSDVRLHILNQHCLMDHKSSRKFRNNVKVLKVISKEELEKITQSSSRSDILSTHLVFENSENSNKKWNPKLTALSEDFDKIVYFNYSERLFWKAFRCSASVLMSLKTKLESYKTVGIKTKERNDVRQFVCTVCSYECQWSDSAIKIRKHVLVEHCLVEEPLVQTCLKITKVDQAMQLLPDEQLLLAVNHRRRKQSAEFVRLRSTSTSSSSSDQDGRTRDIVTRHHRKPTSLVYDEVECKRIFADDHHPDVMRALDKYQWCVVTVHGTSTRTYQCGNCRLFSSRISTRMRRHLLVEHCGLQDDLIDKAMLVCKLDTDQHGDRDADDPTTASTKTTVPMRLDFSDRVLGKTLAHLGENEACQVQQKMAKLRECGVVNEVVKRGPNDRVRQHFMCGLCKSNTFRQFDHAKKHVLVVHCGVPRELVVCCGQVVFHMQSSQMVHNDRTTIRYINKVRSKGGHLPLLIDSDEDQVGRGQQKLIMLEKKKKGHNEDKTGRVAKRLKRECSSSDEEHEEKKPLQQKRGLSLSDEEHKEKKPLQQKPRLSSKIEHEVKKPLQQKLRLSSKEEHEEKKHQSQSKRDCGRSLTMEECRLIKQIKLDYSEDIMWMLCTIENETAEFEGIRQKMTKFRDVQLILIKKDDLYLYACSMCEALFDTEKVLHTHVIGTHTKVPTRLWSLVENCTVLNNIGQLVTKYLPLESE